MNQEFIAGLQQKLGFPVDAQSFLAQSLAKVIGSNQEKAFTHAMQTFSSSDYDFKLVEPLLDAIAEKSHVHRYTVDMLFLLACAEELAAKFANAEIPDSIFIDTMEDLRFKLMECFEVYGIWGTFVTFWYPIFFQMKLFKLGRLEYELRAYQSDTPYTKHGVTLKKGSAIKSIHIPSHNGPLTRKALQDSYEKAYAFFGCAEKNEPLICDCHSWLLHPSTELLLSPASNTVSFIRDFDLLFFEDKDVFDDAWRVFGAQYKAAYNDLPEKTSMQKAYKKHLMNGNMVGDGYGVLIFDGQKTLTQRTS